MAIARYLRLLRPGRAAGPALALALVLGAITEKYQEYAVDIHSSGDHLLELVNEILDLSTIEAGKQSLVKEKLSTHCIA